MAADCLHRQPLFSVILSRSIDLSVYVCRQIFGLLFTAWRRVSTNRVRPDCGTLYMIYFPADCAGVTNIYPHCNLYPPLWRSAYEIYQRQPKRLPTCIIVVYRVCLRARESVNVTVYQRARSVRRESYTVVEGGGCFHAISLV